jgi:hypothetical protein
MTNNLRDDMMFLYGQIQALGFCCIDGVGISSLFERISDDYKSIMDRVLETEAILKSGSKIQSFPPSGFPFNPAEGRNSN